jgi:hypothetical protein
MTNIGNSTVKRNLKRNSWSLVVVNWTITLSIVFTPKTIIFLSRDSPKWNRFFNLSCFIANRKLSFLMFYWIKKFQSMIIAGVCQSWIKIKVSSFTFRLATLLNAHSEKSFSALMFSFSDKTTPDPFDPGPEKFSSFFRSESPSSSPPIASKSSETEIREPFVSELKLCLWKNDAKLLYMISTKS